MGPKTFSKLELTNTTGYGPKIDFSLPSLILALYKESTE